jgi:Secretion system C-terminal sorting domain/Fibronectin type III domain
MKKILPFLLFLSLHGYASKIKDSTPKETNSVSAISALPFIAPQIMLMTQTSNTGFNVQFEDRSTDELDNFFEYKVNGGAWSILSFGPFASTGLQTTPLAFNPSPGTYNISARMRSYKVSGGTNVYTSYTDVYNFVFSNVPPTQPTITNLSSSSTTTANLTWYPSGTNEFEYIIERAPLNGTFEKIATIHSSILSYNDSGLQNNTTYTYRIKACNVSGCSNYTVATVTTKNGSTVPPINATFVSNTETTANISWMPGGPNDSQYLIERSEANGPFNQVGLVQATTLTFNDSGLKHNTLYTYRIKACNIYGCSNFVAGSVTTKNGTPTPPGANSVSPIAATKISINWIDLSSNETNFILQRAGSDLSYQTIDMIASNTNIYYDINLKPNTRYYYRIASTNSFVTSTFTYLGDATTLSGMPSNLGASMLNLTQVYLSWKDNSNDETAFEIFRADINGVFNKIAIVGPNVQNFTDVTVKENTKYFYQVRAVFGSFVSNTIEADVTTPKRQPNDPTNIVATASAYNKVELTWKDNSTDEDGFELERAEGKGFMLLVKLPANTVTYSDTSAKENTTYGYRIRSINTSGKSAYATSEDIKTPFEPIATPTDLVAVANTYNEVKLTWKDNAKNETGYVVEKSTDGTTFTAINLPANTTTYTDNAVVDNASYTYRVFAKNANVSSLKTTSVTVKTPLKPLNPPTVLTLKSLSDNEISLTWQDNEGLETGFEIQRSKDGINFTKIAEVKTNIITYLDANLDASTKYYYRVRAFNDKQFSVFSNIAEVSTLVTTAVSKEKLIETIKVYPNPAQDKINVDYPVGTENVNLLSQFGTLISTKSVDKNSTTTDLNLSGLPSGMYFISAVNQSNKITKKIIKN